MKTRRTTHFGIRNKTMAKKRNKAADENRQANDMAYELYVTLKRAIPDETYYFPAIIGGIEYLIADILQWAKQDANQSKVMLDVISRDVLTIMLKQKEMNNQVN